MLILTVNKTNIIHPLSRKQTAIFIRKARTMSSWKVERASRACFTFTGATGTIMKIRENIHVFIEKLRAAGIPVLEAIESEHESVDDEIKLTETISVQIGHDYFIVYRRFGNGDDLSWQHYPEVNTIDEIVPWYKKAIDDEMTQ